LVNSWRFLRGLLGEKRGRDMRYYTSRDTPSPMTENVFVAAVAHIIREEQARRVFNVVFQQARYEDGYGPWEGESRILCVAGRKDSIIVEALWEKWGLSISGCSIAAGDPKRAKETDETIKSHNLVVRYLETHPEIAIQYQPDQSGKMKYHDVLRLAEREERDGQN
jgi:hypothetical protein